MEKRGLKDIFKKSPDINQEILNKQIETFLAEYRQLVIKHGFDVVPQLQIIKIQQQPVITPVQSLPVEPEKK